MHFLILILIQIGISILSSLLFRPATPKASPIQIPTTDPAAPIPVLFGRRIVAGNVIAFLDYKANAIKKFNLLSLSSTTIGYNYSASMVVALCMGPITKLWDIIAESGQRFSEILPVNNSFYSGDAFAGYTVTDTPSPAALVHVPVNVTSGVAQTLPYDAVEASSSVPTSPPQWYGDVRITLNAPTLYGDKDSGGGVWGDIRFYAGIRGQPVNTFWRDYPLPSVPKIAYTVDAGGIATINLFFRRTITSVRYAVSTVAAPDFSAVSGGTLLSAAPWQFVYSTLSSGQTLYVGVLGYDSGGTASPLGSFSFTFAGSAISGQPLATGSAGSTLGKVPRYNNLSYVVYEDTTLGQQSAPKPLGFELQRTPYALAVGADDMANPVGDANPIAILYELATHRLWGCRKKDSELDLDSWGAASLVLCHTSITGDQIGDGFYLSYLYDDVSAGSEKMDEIHRCIDSVPFVHPVTGKLGIQLIRDDYVVDDLPLYDESNIADIEYTEAKPAQAVNEVRVTFSDRARLYGDNQVMLQNGASIMATGRIVPTTITYKGVTNADLALRLCQRDARAITTPLAKATFSVNREGFSLHEGSPFRFSFAKASVSNMIMRVGKVGKPGRDDSRITIECIQDVFSLPASASVAFVPSGITYDPPGAGMRNSIPVVTPMQDRTATVGALALIIEDPDHRVTKVEFQTQAGRGTLSAWTPATAPYKTTVALDPQYPSLINWRVTYGLPDGTLDTIADTALFDVEQKPPAPRLTYTIDMAGNIAVEAIVNANVTEVIFADSTSGPPSDATTRAGTADSSAPFTYVPAASPLAAGGVDYVTAFAYDADGNESEKGYVTIGSNAAAAAAPCALAGEFGDGKNTTSVVAGTFGMTSRVPFGLVFDRWEVEAYDATLAPVAITCDIDIFATDYSTDSPASITASEHLTLTSASKNTAATLTGWTTTWAADTLFTAKLVSVSGAATKIIFAVRGTKS